MLRTYDNSFRNRQSNLLTALLGESWTFKGFNYEVFLTTHCSQEGSNFQGCPYLFNAHPGPWISFTCQVYVFNIDFPSKDFRVGCKFPSITCTDHFCVMACTPPSVAPCRSLSGRCSRTTCSRSHSAERAFQLWQGAYPIFASTYQMFLGQALEILVLPRLWSIW